MCIEIISFPIGDGINFEIYRRFLIPSDQKSRDKNLSVLRTKRSFKMKQKVYFIKFKVFSVAKNCLRPESVTN